MSWLLGEFVEPVQGENGPATAALAGWDEFDDHVLVGAVVRVDSPASCQCSNSSRLEAASPPHATRVAV
jgi:hypothetical protein